MLKCPHCGSGLPFRQLITAGAVTTCANCESKLLVSGAMAAVAFVSVFGGIGSLAAIWLSDNLAVLSAMTVVVFLMIWFAAVWMFYDVALLSEKKLR